MASTSTSPSSSSSSAPRSSGRTAATGGELLIAEEVFLIVRELSPDRSFRFKDWKRAWQTVRPPNPWTGPDSCTMALCGALKQQLLNGTVKRIARGLYFFVQDRATAPFSLKRSRPQRRYR